jgi:DnaK suppressor protein
MMADAHDRNRGPGCLPERYPATHLYCLDVWSFLMPASPKLLTEAQLLKMPASAYMNAEQLAFFRARLEALRDEMLANAADTGEHLKENENFADPNDRATVEEEHMLEQRVRDRERKLLKKIQSALVRLDAGDFGYCKETGDPIGLPRMLARPTAEYSIEAQERHERKEKLHA